VHDVVRKEAEVGVDVVSDDAILTHWYDRITDEGGDYRKWVAQRVEVINHALRGIPEQQVRYHVCWGSWPGPHTSDVPLRAIVDLILKINAQGFSIEAANPRHEWEWTVPSVVWAKLAALAEGAGLASRRHAAV
jgi:5-methyltetrahydropteroyltriglutamate--homocysteine methyltransferase